MFVPFFDRSYFTNREMSLVDQNYPLLNQYLRSMPIDPAGENTANNPGNEEEQALILNDNGDDEIIRNRGNQAGPNGPQIRPGNHLIV